MMRIFYMVWNENTHVTNFQHPSFEEAKAEAERLARNNPGTRFYVLQSLGAARKTDVDWQGCDDALPF